MDRYNPRKILKTSDIDDGYWRFSLMLADQLIKAMAQNNERDILRLLDSPKLFIGRT
tara:strand:- start:9 stop:179 length:171 start_codon:yes stop_codon:yes gene_type:complete